MPNVLLIPRASGYVSPSANGRSYPVAATIVAPDFDSQVLGANGWICVGETGPTTARPKAPAAGAKYVDSTLGELVVFDGAAWRDITGAAV